jgi:hypothetical protein
MNFQSPLILWFLVLLAPAAYALYRGGIKTRRMLELLGEPFNSRLHYLRQALSLVLLASLCLTAAGPQYQLALTGQGGSGRFVFLIDVSRSMAARADCGDPTELDRSRKLILSILRAMPTAEFGIAGFTELTFTLTELSDDHRYLEDVVEQALFVESVPMPGSDINNALLVIAEKKQEEPPVYAGVDNVILLSDGDFSKEVLAQIPETMTRIQEAGIKVTAVGIGPEEGLPVPTLDKDRQCLEGRYERAEGKEFLAQLFPAPLQNIAEATGGQYFDSTDEDALIRTLRSRLQQNESDVPPVRTVDMTPFSLLVATIFLALMIWARKF